MVCFQKQAFLIITFNETNCLCFCLHADYFQLEQQANSGNGNNNPAQRKSPTDQQNIMYSSGVIMPLLDAPTMPPQMAPPPVNRDPRTAAQQQQQQQMMMGTVPSLLGAPPPGLQMLPGKVFSVPIFSVGKSDNSFDLL